MKKSLPLFSALAVLVLTSASAMAADVSADVNSTLNPANPANSAIKAPVKTEATTDVEIKTEQTQVEHNSQSETKVEPTQPAESKPSKSSNDALENDDLKQETQSSVSSSTNVQKLFSTFHKDKAPEVEANAEVTTNSQLPEQK
ncbi:hypothetical protein [Vampirovibrio sp.]|uniref:hypothetical protein n=1 Tax=Vampirovibrio sp. TaxID=2717857 RepID=UPI003593401C